MTSTHSRSRPAHLSKERERVGLVRDSWIEDDLRHDAVMTLAAMVFGEIQDNPVPGFDPMLFITQLTGINLMDVSLAVGAMKTRGLVTQEDTGYKLTEHPDAITFSSMESVNFVDDQMPREGVMEALHEMLDAQLAINGLAASYSHDFYAVDKQLTQFYRDNNPGIS